MINVAIIDDNKFSKVIINGFFKDVLKKDVLIDYFENGKIFLDYFFKEENSSKYSLIFCDIWMPELSGFDVLDKLQASNLLIPPVLVISSHYECTDELKKYDFVIGFISKPIFFESLKKYQCLL